LLYAITRTEGDATVVGRCRFASWREAMNFATISNLDAPDSREASYGVVLLCPTDPLSLLRESLQRFVDQGCCQCDPDVDKETGTPPPLGKNTTFWGDPIWGERCDFCHARSTLAETSGEAS
jgi:hypothetical protein